VASHVTTTEATARLSTGCNRSDQQGCGSQNRKVTFHDTISILNFDHLAVSNRKWAGRGGISNID
jgi:hypothetical protein